MKTGFYPERRRSAALRRRRDIERLRRGIAALLGVSESDVWPEREVGGE